MSKKYIEDFIPEPDKTKFLNKIEVYRLISEGLPPLEKKVEYLASKKQEIINYEKTFNNFQKVMARDPTDSGIKRIIELANEIVGEEKDKKKALKILNEIRSISVKILRETSNYIRVQRDMHLSKAIYYKKVAEQVKKGKDEHLQVSAKMRGMIDTQVRILEAIVKNEAEYKKLLKRKESGESVEDLIRKNREDYENLKKEDKESSEIALQWGRSEEGRKMFARLDMLTRMNPNIARKVMIKNQLKMQITTLNEKIKKNDEEYEELLRRKNKGEYVDDLIEQNRYTANNLKQTKKDCENNMNKLGLEK